jgi:cytochrome c biogenesis protein ResB
MTLLLKKIFNFFRSIKLAIFLITYIITTSLIASLIPQGLKEDYYYSQFNSYLTKLILFFQFDNFFYSFIFIFPVIIFSINVASCTIYRIYHRRKINLKKKHGPDLIHIGLLLVLLSGVYSNFDREESLVFLNAGEKDNLRNGYQITLKKFDIETYDSGMVKDWISDVEIRRNGELIKNYKIEVNKPCAFDQYKVYQYSYRKTLNVTLQDENGRQFSLDQGSVFDVENKNYMLSDILTQNNGNEMFVIFDEYNGNEKTNNQIKLALYDSFGHYTVKFIQVNFVSGLNIVKDNSYRIVFFAIFIMIIGLIMTYYKGSNKGVKK